MDSKPRSGGLTGEEKRVFMDMVRSLALTLSFQALLKTLSTGS